MIHKELLKQLGLHKDASVSDWIRIKRNRLFRFVNTLVGTITKRETYTCNHTTNLPGQKLLDEATMVSSNDLANSAHVNSGTTHDYVATILNRDSVDNKGMTLTSSVNYDVNYNNAFWNGSQMVYGDGDGKFFSGFSKDLSVIAHEFSHGITQTTCGLWYYGQSGALNEAFSDISGIACRHWYEQDKDPKTANWLIGDKCLGTSFPGKAIRSFKDEKAYDGDNQPKNFKKLLVGTQDNGNVHGNSGPKNHCFYVLCLKLNEPSYGKPIQIVWEGHKTLKPWSNFKAAAKAEYKAALKLYGQEVATVVKEAYHECGLDF